MSIESYAATNVVVTAEALRAVAAPHYALGELSLGGLIAAGDVYTPAGVAEPMQYHEAMQA